MTLSLLAWVGSGAAVERFECALSLLPARCVGGWIVGAGENGALGAVAELGGRIGGSGHSNGAQRIVNLLFWLCNALITNDDSTNYPLLIAAGGRRGGAGAGFDQGGRGAGASDWLDPYNTSAPAKFVPIAPSSALKNRAPKKGGAGGPFNQHTARGTRS